MLPRPTKSNISAGRRDDRAPRIIDTVAAVLLAASSAVAAPAAVIPNRLPPIEACRGDADFDRFRAELSAAVELKDVAGLRTLAADDIQSSFGGDGGWDEFAAAWGLDQPQKSALWKELEDVIALGCAKTEAGGRVFPGLFEDMGEADPFELLVVRPGTPLRSAADSNAPATTIPDWSATLQLDASAPEGWVKVQVPGGPRGWVETGLTISPIGYRLVSEFRNGRWWITAFVAGD